MSALAVVPSADAHGIAGNRYFPGTLTFDDPAVADELILPNFLEPHAPKRQPERRRQRPRRCLYASANGEACCQRRQQLDPTKPNQLSAASRVRLSQPHAQGAGL
jgi:hypothetical protein